MTDQVAGELVVAARESVAGAGAKKARRLLVRQLGKVRGRNSRGAGVVFAVVSTAKGSGRLLLEVVAL